MDIVRVVGRLNPPEGMVGSEVGVMVKQGLFPLMPHVAASPPVMVMVGVSLPVPILLMQRYVLAAPPAGSLKLTGEGVVV